eukprot:CAMPEP_0113937792 /NCGR_PEP_ID=MMETSP1339-20121228/4334_1 /TAXON_ID=94617 /ORGANISM="Fibrocapsa japonica" /LENGTH=223 /DNA_ID=CAMNT_0000940691 /DNA_START=64 /DNA_END=735 /DNA_ORIENTATION=+ /assembly_acc=CAM_ASM_000762
MRLLLRQYHYLSSIVLLFYGFHRGSCQGQLVLKTNLPVSLEQFRSQFLDNGSFTEKYLTETKEKNIKVGKWKREGGVQVRESDFMHPVKKKMIGVPSHAPTHLTQEYRFTKKKLEIHDCSVVSKIPYSSYFMVHIYWVVEPVQAPRGSTGSWVAVEARVEVEFVKNTIMKGKISSDCLAETKEALKIWLALVQLLSCELDKSKRGTCEVQDDQAVLPTPWILG